jgi:hypothetical protein
MSAYPALDREPTPRLIISDYGDASRFPADDEGQIPRPDQS